MALGLLNGEVLQFAIIVDRYIAVFWPLKQVLIMTQKRANIIVAVIWLYGTTTCLFAWTLPLPLQTDIYCSIGHFLTSNLLKGFVIANIMLCLTVIICLYIRIFWQAYKQKRQIVAFQLLMSQVQKKDARITQMMALVLGVFLLCWVPNTVITIIYKSTKKPTLWLTILLRLSLFLL